MQQRRLRLGDILDDYCPRERRVTNHVVVAMIDEQVKQTRCTTCDADHEYKAARVPSPRRKKDAGVPSELPADSLRATKGDDQMIDDDTLDVETGDAPQLADAADADPLAAAAGTVDPDGDDAVADEDPRALLADDDGPVHRPLIRATLPRQEGQLPEWKEPEFTVRQPGGSGRPFDPNRNGHGGQGGGQGQGQGRPGRNRRPMRAGGGGGAGGGQPSNASGPGPSRFGGPRHGGGGNPRGAGPGQGNGRGPGGGQSGGPRGAARSDQRGPGRKRGR